MKATATLMGDGVNIAARLEGRLRAGRDLPFRGRLSPSQRPTRFDGERPWLDPTSRTSPKPIRSIRRKSARPCDEARTSPRPEKSAPPRLSMVVLPFANIGGDPEQEHFVDGVTESLTTDLSRIRGLPRNCPQYGFAYKGKRLDVGQSAAS